MPRKRKTASEFARPRPSHASPARGFGKATGRDGKRARLALILTLGCLFFFPTQSHAAAEVSREFQIKAALLQWLPYYVEWPPTAFASKDAPLLIGILGPDRSDRFWRTC